MRLNAEQYSFSRLSVITIGFSKSPVPMNKSETSVTFVTELAPKPYNKVDGDISLNDLLTAYIKSLYSFGLSSLTECIHFLSSKVKFDIEQSIPIKGTICKTQSATKFKNEVRRLHYIFLREIMPIYYNRSLLNKFTFIDYSSSSYFNGFFAPPWVKLGSTSKKSS